MLSNIAYSSGIILIFLPTIGKTANFPKKFLYLSSLGLTAIAVSASMVSGLVVAIVISSDEFSI